MVVVGRKVDAPGCSHRRDGLVVAIDHLVATRARKAWQARARAWIRRGYMAGALIVDATTAGRAVAPIAQRVSAAESVLSTLRQEQGTDVPKINNEILRLSLTAVRDTPGHAPHF